MAKPYFKKSHKAWYANLNGQTVKLGRTESEAFAEYARRLNPAAPEVASPAADGGPAPFPAVTGPTLAELVDKFCAHVTANSPKGTVQSYTRYARRWAALHGSKAAASIIGADITAAADKLYRLRTLMTVSTLTALLSIVAVARARERTFLDSDAPPLSLPEGSTVTHLVVSEPDIPGAKLPPPREIVISDQRRIKRLLEFVNARNRGWWTPWDTPSVGSLAIVVMSKDKPLLVIWEGGDWIGGKELAVSKSVGRQHSLSEKDRTDLYDLLGIKMR